MADEMMPEVPHSPRFSLSQAQEFLEPPLDLSLPSLTGGLTSSVDPHIDQITVTVKQGAMSYEKKKIVGKCIYCDELFTDFNSLIACYWRHVMPRPFACYSPGCVERFATSDEALYHFEKYHLPHGHLYVYRCPICNISITDQETMEQHKKNHEKENDMVYVSFLCKICGSAYHQQEEFVKHISRHAVVTCEIKFPDIVPNEALIPALRQIREDKDVKRLPVPAAPKMSPEEFFHPGSQAPLVTVATSPVASPTVKHETKESKDSKTKPKRQHEEKVFFCTGCRKEFARKKCALGHRDKCKPLKAPDGKHSVKHFESETIAIKWINKFSEVPMEGKETDELLKELNAKVSDIED